METINKNHIYFVAIITYSNASTDKNKIMKDNKGKAGIYMWTHIESGRIYIGSSVDLSIRLNSYYSSYYLERTKIYICNALRYHSHLAFSLSILEYIDISGLSLEDAKN